MAIAREGDTVDSTPIVQLSGSSMPIESGVAHPDHVEANAINAGAHQPHVATLFFREGLSSYSGSFVGATIIGLAGSTLGILPGMAFAVAGFVLGSLLGIWLDLRHRTLLR